MKNQRFVKGLRANKPFVKKLTIVLCATTIAGVVFAGDKEYEERPSYDPCYLNLSVEQEKKIASLATEFKANMIPLVARNRAYA